MVLFSDIDAQDEGVSQGRVDAIDFAGAGVTLAVSGKKATATIPGGGSTFDPSTASTDFDDFTGLVGSGGATSVKFGTMPLTTALSGTGTNVLSVAGSTSHPGVLQCTTGTTNAALAGAQSAINSILFGDGVCTIEAEIIIPTLSTAGEEYDIYFGFMDSFAGTAPVDGAYFHYDRNTSVNWLRGTASNSTATETDSGTAVGTGWTKLKIVVNTAATSVEFFINGVSVGSNTTNIPTGAGRETGYGFFIFKSAGTTARTFSVDYLKFDLTLATAR